MLHETKMTRKNASTLLKNILQKNVKANNYWMNEQQNCWTYVEQYYLKNEQQSYQTNEQRNY